MANSRAAASHEEIHAAIACLQRLSEVFRARREQIAGEGGLTDHQWGVLEEISSEHFMPSLFARSRDSTPAAVSKTIRQLIDKGLISVSVSKDDGRQRNYELTSKGKRVMTKLRQSRQDAIDDIWVKLAGDDIRDFTRFGNDLAERIEAYLTRPISETASKATTLEGQQ